MLWTFEVFLTEDYMNLNKLALVSNGTFEMNIVCSYCETQNHCFRILMNLLGKLPR